MWESSAVCLLAPPAGQEQEQLECPGLCAAPLDYCPPPQMRTAAGVSALKHREESEEMKGVEKNKTFIKLQFKMKLYVEAAQ